MSFNPKPGPSSPPSRLLPRRRVTRFPDVPARQDFANLRKYDQLQQQMTAGKVLQGFSALVPTWEPTYRMQKGDFAEAYPRLHLGLASQYGSGQAGVNFDTARVPSEPELADAAEVNHWCLLTCSTCQLVCFGVEFLETTVVSPLLSLCLGFSVMCSLVS